MFARKGVLPVAAAVLIAAPALAQPAAAPAPLAAGTPAPSVKLLVNGKPAPLKTLLAGNRNLILLYPAACGGACDATLRSLDKSAIQELDQRGVAVFGATPDAAGDIAKTVERLALAYPIFSDPGGAALQAFHTTTTPRAYLIDHEGAIRAAFQGPLSASGVLAAVKALKKRPHER
jgi:peroxiredoxin Q/BCP